MTSQGSAYARFRRALKTGNMALIRSAAGELPHVELGDALAVCIVIRKAEPHRFEQAALRWLARFCVERREATLAEVSGSRRDTSTHLTSAPACGWGHVLADAELAFDGLSGATCFDDGVAGGSVGGPLLSREAAAGLVRALM